MDNGLAVVSKPLMIDAAGALKVEVGTSIVCAILLVWIIYDTRKRGELSYPALCAIAGFSIWWQEAFADWGAYLLWSDAFHLMPWGETMWTTPRKPWSMLVSYPVFMCFSISLMLWLCRKALQIFQNSNRQLVCFVTAGIMLIIINTLLELASVSAAGQWTYVDVIGPAISTVHGLQPLLYPNLPFGVWGGVICALILSQAANNYPGFETITRAHQLKQGWPRESARALAWMIVWNVTYWLFLCTPLIAMRVLWGNPNPLVP